MTDYQLNNKQIFNVAIISAVVTFITILACQVVYYALRDQHEQYVIERGEYRVGNRILREQNESISQYGVNRETGQLQIPIDRAMELVVSEQEQQGRQGQPEVQGEQEEENPDEA